MRSSTREAGWKEEGQDLLRGIATGTIFGMPLLYTMEVWFHGVAYSEERLITILSVILCFNILLSSFVGLRTSNEGFDLFGAVEDGITSVALGILISTGILLIVGKLQAAGGFQSSLGKVLIEACAVSIGVNFANSKFGPGKDARNDDDEKDKQKNKQKNKARDPDREQLKIDLKDFASTAAGALVFTLNIAPTEEVTLIASSLSPLRLMSILVFEIAIAYIILFAAGFSDRKNPTDSFFQSAAAETVMAVAVSIIISGGLLVLFGESPSLESIPIFMSCLVVLSLPAVVGGAAGRVVL